MDDYLYITRLGLLRERLVVQLAHHAEIGGGGDLVPAWNMRTMLFLTVSLAELLPWNWIKSQPNSA
jgi:hypothetical protein